MAGTKLTTPNIPLSSDADWKNLIDQLYLIGHGIDGLALSEWDSGNTTIPQILEGSFIEVDGCFVTFDSDTAVAAEGGSVAGTLYIAINITSGTPVVYFTNTPPEWNAELNGYYASGDNNIRYSRYAMTWDGASSYNSKRKSLDKYLNYWLYAGETN